MSISVAEKFSCRKVGQFVKDKPSVELYSKGKHDSTLFSVEAASKIPAAFGKPIKSTLTASENPILDALATI